MTLQYAMAMLLSGDHPAVVDCDFVIHNLHLPQPLILIALSKLGKGISDGDVLPWKGGEVVAHSFNCSPPICWIWALVIHLLFSVSYPSIHPSTFNSDKSP